MGLPRQKYWSGLSCPPPEDLPHPGIDPHLLCLLHWHSGSLPLAPPGKPVISMQKVPGAFDKPKLASLLLSWRSPPISGLEIRTSNS